ncbi:hypothetical protein [Streptococcus saliviloxodontae]|uniref:Uncharacterized protein n=1 Tax=Streptococcus saliviloxodontae TaxID=1349416 RepID=A0ABS2PIQ0_9STRE|nr:hypothetical protein [Streptococcus saliviloxodontae]MBM7635303.1 hypothetical protein [Streptococcus saliviloxodontae]
MRTVIGIRTHKWDVLVKRAYEDLLTCFSASQIYIICDEISGQLIDLPEGLNKVSLSKDFLEKTGLKSTYDGLNQEDWYNPTKHRLGWLCGDYFYYAFHQAVEAECYWLFEPDVYLTPSMRQLFFKRLCSLKSDALLPYYALANESWYWRPKMAVFEDRIYKTYFPLSRLSARAVEVCLDERRRVSRRMREEGIADTYFPNDESLVATSLAKSDLTVEDIRTYFEPDAFRYFSIKSTIFTTIEDKLNDGCYLIPPFLGK